MRPLASLMFGAALFAGCASDPHDEPVDCALETRADDFVIGLEKTGTAGKLGFRLIATDPSPQFAGDNAWTVLINRMAAGAVVGPLAGAAMSVTPYMPDHMHVAPKDVTVTPLAEPGQYKLETINTWMKGLWETTINVTGADGDKVVFKTCIPG
jgi:hypothetical protein